MRSTAAFEVHGGPGRVVSMIRVPPAALPRAPAASDALPEALELRLTRHGGLGSTMDVTVEMDRRGRVVRHGTAAPRTGRILRRRALARLVAALHRHPSYDHRAAHDGSTLVLEYRHAGALWRYDHDSFDPRVPPEVRVLERRLIRRLGARPQRRG